MRDQDSTQLRPPGAVDFPQLAKQGGIGGIPRASIPPIETRLILAAAADLLGPGGLSPPRARTLGRSIGQAGDGPETAILEAFGHLGVGHLVAAEDAHGRAIFESADLFQADRAKAPTCALALGLVEGLLSRDGHQALGTEMRCRSRGAEKCTFVVRPGPAADQPNASRKDD